MKPVWLVTGAGSGVGRVLAVALATSGSEVILSARTVAALEDTSRWCGAGASVAPVDLSDPESVVALAFTVEGILAGRPLAGIVHAAGVMTWDSPATPSGWSRVPLVNALSPWRLTQALEPALLRQRGGRVLFVAGAPLTLSGVIPDPSRWSGDQKGRGLRLALEAASAKVTMARVLHRRWAGQASAFAFHPGFVKSHLADGLPFPLGTLGCLVQGLLATRSRTGEFLALSPEAVALSGNLIAGSHAVAACPLPSDPEAEDALVGSWL